MASPGLPEGVTAGVTTGHPSWHEKVHDLANEFDVDAFRVAANGSLLLRRSGLWVPLAHPGVSGKVLKTLTSDPFYEWADDITGGTGPSIDTDVQYVHDGSGQDANSGFSPGAAKKTIEAGVGDLPATGGEVVVLPGTYNDVFTITKDNVKLKGSGIGNTNWDIALNQHALIVDGAAKFSMSDFTMLGNNSATSGGGVFLKGVDGFSLERLWGNQVGFNTTTTLGIDSRPFLLRFEGSAAGWCRGSVIDLHMEFVHTGLILSGGGVFVQFANIVGRADMRREHLYVRHQARAGAPSTISRVHLTNTWFAHGEPGEYAIRLEREAGTPLEGLSQFASVTIEPGAGSGAHHHYIETNDNSFANVGMVGGGTTTVTPQAANFAGGCTGNRWTNVVRNPQGGAPTPNWTGNVAGQIFRE